MSSSRFRRVALSLPAAIEGSHQGRTDFRAGKRIFATLGYPDDKWGMVKLTPEQQSVLVEAEPEIFRPSPEHGASKATPMCGSPKPTRRRSGAPSHGVAQRRAEDALKLQPTAKS